METIEAYLARKFDELKLLNSFLSNPMPIRPPKSAHEVVERKFHLAAALKAEHILQDWSLTETAWADSERPHSGPFEFEYDYQRADLKVRGPSFYSMQNGANGETVYASSGMAAISGVLMASAHVFSEADIFVGANSYGETIELIDSYAKHLNRVEICRSVEHMSRRRSRSRILLVDSCTPTSPFDATVFSVKSSFDLIVFDTTCFAGGSSRIGRILRFARDAMIPVVMVRSHNKLDSLGVEYGRLGSAVFIDNPGHTDTPKSGLLQRLIAEMRKSLRIFGGAALPAHFPPYVGGNDYRALTDKRVALILQNCRRTARYFSARLAGLTDELNFAHGLYVTLAPAEPINEKQARDTTEEMCSDLGKAGFLLRHAGSFGFDFGAAEWGRDGLHGRYVVRLAVPDLPEPIWRDIAQSVASWWQRHHGRCPAAHSGAKIMSSVPW